MTKSCLRKVLGKAFVSLVALQTVVTKVECILNDRPLTYVSSDPADEQPLTQSHLFHGGTITSLTYPDERSNETEMILTRYTINQQSQRVQQITQHFWTRWRNEYLTSFKQFHRCKRKDCHNVKVGDVVLVHNISLKNKWPLAIVEELIIG